MNDKKLIEYILFAQQDLDEQIEKKDLQTLIFQIDSINKVFEIDEDPNNSLWRWIPAIVFNKFGFECYQKIKPKNYEKSSIVMLNPCNVNALNDLTTALNEEGFKFSIDKFTFLCSTMAQVYGGFPWYESYKRLCQELDIYGKTGYLFTIEEDENIDIIECLRVFKNENRYKFGNEIKREYDLLDYPGILNCFHTPNYIENSRHIKVLMNSIYK
jgi:hypothetical protein